MADYIINLLDNPAFKLWVLSPNSAGDNYWRKFLDQNPHMREAAQKARLILIALDQEFGFDLPSGKKIETVVRKIFAAQ